MPETVPLEPFRQAFKRSGLTAEQVAIRMGYLRSREKRGEEYGDATRILRLLNMVKQTNTVKNGRHYGGTFKHDDRIQYEVAARLAEALGADPWEVGV